MKKITPEQEKQILEECLEHGKMDNLIRQYANLVSYAVRGTLRMKHISFTEDHIEDLRNDVFVRLFDKSCRLLAQYSEKKGSLGNWIKVITVSTMLNQTRKRGYDSLYSGRGRVTIEDEWQEHGLKRLQNDLKNIENLLTLKDIIEKLPATEKLVLKLEYYDGLTMDDIASYLNKSKGAAYTIKSRAIAHMKKLTNEN